MQCDIFFFFKYLLWRMSSSSAPYISHLQTFLPQQFNHFRFISDPFFCHSIRVIFVQQNGCFQQLNFPNFHEPKLIQLQSVMFSKRFGFTSKFELNTMLLCKIMSQKWINFTYEHSKQPQTEKQTMKQSSKRISAILSYWMLIWY